MAGEATEKTALDSANELQQIKNFNFTLLQKDKEGYYLNHSNCLEDFLHGD